MDSVSLIILAITSFFIRQLYKLYQNYQDARKTGLPVILAPVDPYSFFWQISGNLSVPIVKKLPECLTLWCRVSDLSWSWAHGDRIHRKLGTSFMLASPGRNLLITSDPEVINTVLQNRKAFIKPDIYEPLNFFGRNVDTVNGEEWSRHRKLTAPCFNERVSGFVWDESTRQAQSMLAHWLSSNKGKLNSVHDDTRVVALHVLSAAGFGISHDFHGGARKPAEGYQMSHIESLMTVLNHLIMIIAFPWNLKFLNLLLPEKIRRIGTAVREFRRYMDDMITNERRAMAKEQGMSKPNLISALIRTSDEAKTSGASSSVRLSDDEIKGNIFIFNLAGHDTTANTLAYAFLLLALHPEYQEWVVEEIYEVLGKEEWPEYEKTHPRLKRIMAVMYETLRLYGPVPTIPRGIAPSNTHPSILLTSPSPSQPASTLVIPQTTNITLNIHASHTNSTLFPSPTTFNPKRWIHSSSASPTPQLSLSTETLLPPSQGFAPWSLGPRICPGMKFAQVEFSAVLSTVLRRVRVTASSKGAAPGVELTGPGLEAAKKELEGVIRDSGFMGVTLSMRRGGDAWVQCFER
ncbi:cytochrome P450 [Zopfia rhizophila CBS 207.26]|uniref:Cytochrome P450 n=1 Tax=Zopfia rhizophila CBS 207.26 TaxID=1314779 RepID=A0A6A6EWP4_9PEZI|nr:cytochrome P450 [Zopfia rhizophila CBS 207.26]